MELRRLVGTVLLSIFCQSGVMRCSSLMSWSSLCIGDVTMIVIKVAGGVVVVVDENERVEYRS